MSAYSFVRLNKENLKDLILISKGSFERPFQWAELCVKYSTGESKESFVGYVARDNGNQPAAYYGVFLCSLRIAGALVYSSQSGDTMTHYLHRGQGFFSEGAKLT